MKNVIKVSILALVILVPELAAAPRGRVVGELVEPVFEKAGRRVLGDGAGAAVKGIRESVLRNHGGEGLRLFDSSAPEFLRLAAREGEGMVDVALRAGPAARKLLFENSTEAASLVRRFGREALEIEAKAPGLAARVHQSFDAASVRKIAWEVPGQDIPRLLKYAEKADSPATRNALIDCYRKEGKGLFRRIPPSLVASGGLTAAMLYGTHRTTQPFVAVAGKIGERDDFAAYALGGCILLAAFFGTLVFWRFGLLPRRRSGGKR